MGQSARQEGRAARRSFRGSRKRAAPASRWVFRLPTARLMAPDDATSCSVDRPCGSISDRAGAATRAHRPRRWPTRRARMTAARQHIRLARGDRAPCTISRPEHVRRSAQRHTVIGVVEMAQAHAPFHDIAAEIVHQPVELEQRRAFLDAQYLRLAPSRGHR